MRWLPKPPQHHQQKSPQHQKSPLTAQHSTAPTIWYALSASCSVRERTALAGGPLPGGLLPTCPPKLPGPARPGLKLPGPLLGRVALAGMGSTSGTGRPFIWASRAAISDRSAATTDACGVRRAVYGKVGNRGCGNRQMLQNGVLYRG